EVAVAVGDELEPALRDAERRGERDGVGGERRRRAGAPAVNPGRGRCERRKNRDAPQREWMERAEVRRILVHRDETQRGDGLGQVEAEPVENRAGASGDRERAERSERACVSL